MFTGKVEWMRLFEFISYLYRSQQIKLFIAIFIVALIAVRIVTEGVNTITLLGFLLGLAFLMLMDRGKIIRTLVILVGVPCIMLAIITGYPPSEGYQNSITGFVAGGCIMLLYREYVHYRNNITK